MQGQQIRNQIQIVHLLTFLEYFPLFIYIRTSAKKMHAEPQPVQDMQAITTFVRKVPRLI